MNQSLRELERFSRERLAHSFYRWVPLILAATAVGALSAFIVSRALPPEYRATAQLYLTPASNATLTVSFQDVVMGQNLARSYVQLASADVVLGPAMEKVGGRDLRGFREQTQVAQVRDTSVIEISFRDQDAERAATAANAIADSFMTQTKALQSEIQGTTVSQLEEQISSVQEDIKGLDTRIAFLQTELSATPTPEQTPVPRADIQTQVLQLDALRQTKQQTLAQLLKTRGDMRLALARAENTVSLWQPATAPTKPESPRVGTNTVFGGLSAGFLVFLVLAGISYLDDRLTDLDQVRSRLGIAALGQVHLSENPDSLTGKLFLRDQSTSPEAEAFRSLRTSILFANVDKRPQVILVTSALPREGKSITSANLAMAFAEAGTPTILIDADLRRPSQHRLFGVSSGAGLSSFLTDDLPMAALERFQVSPNLAVIPCGPLPPNPAGLLSSARMTTFVRDLAGLADGTIVIIDTSPVLAVADPIALSTKVDGCIVVIDSAHTNTRAARHAIDSLQQVHAPIMGAVLNKISEAHTSYHYYNYEDSERRTDPHQIQAEVQEGRRA